MEEALNATDRMRPDHLDVVYEFEIAAAADDEEAARKALKRYLATARGVACEGSLGELAAGLAKRSEGQQGSAAMLLRALAVPGVVQPNAANSLARSIVSIVETALPDALRFGNVEPKQQTFIRFAAIEKIHDLVLVRLDRSGSPIRRSIRYWRPRPMSCDRCDTRSSGCICDPLAEARLPRR